MVVQELQNMIYIFGGLDNDNATLNDMWSFDLTANVWTRIEQQGNIPRPRCGHSFNEYDNKIFLFGGSLEVTQESSELFQFDIATQTWSLLKSKELECNDSAKQTLGLPGMDQLNSGHSTTTDPDDTHNAHTISHISVKLDETTKHT